MKIRRRAIGFFLLMALVLGCIGCAANRGEEQGVLRYNLGPEPQTLDPALATGEPELTAILACFEGLTRLAPNGEIVPGVAKDWAISPDACTYTFYLREDAKWSNGEPVQAADFVYSWRRVLQPELASPYAYQLYVIENAAAFNSGEITDPELIGVQALDAHTLQVDLEHPTGYFLSLVAFPTYFPVHGPLVGERDGDWWLDPDTYIGNGPFVLKNWVGRQRLSFAPNDKYWDKDKVRLGGLEFVLVEDPATELALFEAGDIHLANHLPAGELRRLKEEGCLRQGGDLAVNYYYINTQAGPLADTRVRRALALAINRRDLVDFVTRGGEDIALALVPPGVEIGGVDFRREGGPYIPDNAGDEARALLAEAGYPRGEGFPLLDLLIPAGGGFSLQAEALQEMWFWELGIELAIRPLEWQTFLTSAAEGDFDLAAVGWNADYIDPNSFLEVFLSQGGNNFSLWQNEEYDGLLAAAQMEVEPARRRELYHRAEELLLGEMPLIPLYFPLRHYLQAEELQDVFLSPLGMVDFKWASLGD
ncbi:MAG: peptide ABC transporter substrate-binding protein [Firmicutes bacterium]|nr:peptide ABC transporter substrate-binding protein [Bacillota bacterium]